MLSVIFVDDEERVLRGIKRSLKRFHVPWKMDFALTGKDALALFETKHYDVIVSDMMMPEMSGEELLGIILEKYSNTARIVLSGHCDQATAFRLVGSDHFYLAKPCPIDLLIDTIENAHLISDHNASAVVEAEEVQEALCEFVKLLLMRGVIKINVVPASIKKWLPKTTLEAFAPVAGEYNEFLSKTNFSSNNWPEQIETTNGPDKWDDYFNGD